MPLQLALAVVDPSNATGVQQIAGASRAAVGQMMQMALTNVARFLRGEVPLDMVRLPGGS